MGGWSRFVSPASATRAITGLGALYVGFATLRAIFVVATGRPIAAAVIDFVLVGGPGIVVLYGGYRLPRTDLDRDTFPRIAAWCLGGFVVALAIIELVNLEPGVTIAYPRWTFLLGAAVGTAAGLGIGVNDARAITHANTVERHNRELERQNGRLESFARMVAHELRNPLSIAQIYSRQAAAGDEKAADEVETALDRIEEMIDVLLVTARGTEANIDARPVSLSDAAAEVWDDLGVEGGNLVVEADQTVLADPIHLHHLLENLFKNAVEHGSTAGSQESEVTVRVGSLDGGFYVEDDGPGIPEDEREAVFDAGHTTDEDGIGLGLTFVAQLADTYGWECEITESEAGGARFEFTGVEQISTPPRHIS